MYDLEALGPCNSFLEVDLDTFAANIEKIRRHVGPQVKLISVLKGNAYAAGLTEIARFFTRDCGVEAIACAQTREAAQIRAAGVDCDILVMGGVPFHNIPEVVARDLMSPAYHAEYLRRLDAQAAREGKTARVHIKIETGLGRIGVRPGEQLEALCRLLGTLPHLRVVGVYTHFAEAEAADKSYTLLQMERFRQALAQIEACGYTGLPYIHAFNTAAVSWLRDPQVTHIRAGGLFFGFDPGLNPVNALKLEETLSWRAFVTEVKTVDAGETVGYGRHFKAEKPTRVATVSVGYGDGYARHLAMECGAQMLVGGQRANVIGFCMDQAFLDVTGIDVTVNDTVTLLGRDGDAVISVFELEEKMGQTYLATLAPIAGRVLRVYIRHGRPYFFD